MFRTLRPGEFSELNAFAAVAEARSFRRAATHLRVDPSTLSHAVRSLETRLGLRLLHRTTRSVQLSDAGARLLEQLSPALSQLGDALTKIETPQDAPSGTVRIVAPRLAIRFLLAPVIARLARDYPHVILDIIVEEHAIASQRPGYDLAIRFGDAISQDMVAVPLIPTFTTAVVGSPAYFSATPCPTTPRDLVNHNCINCRCGPDESPYRWVFERDGQSIVIDVEGSLTTDDPDLMRSAALDGVGLWHGVREFVGEELADGRLIHVLADWSPTYPGFHLTYTSGAPLGPAARVVIDTLKNARHSEAA